MININNLSHRFGERQLFNNVNLLLNKSQRYGIVGANGSGKSTFLTLLADKQEGAVAIAKNTSMGWLKQDHYQYENDRVIDVVLRGKPLLWQAIQLKQSLLAKQPFTDADGMKLAEAEMMIAEQDGYTAESSAIIILQGLGIKAEYHQGALSALSGGYKLRVLLAQALFQSPDILLLDEPTNHLDIVSINWLEKFLINGYKGLLLFVSHDQDFLNGVATRILDIDYQSITTYVGGYDDYIRQKAEIRLQKQRELASKQQQISQMQTFVDRFGSKASLASRAQSKKKMIDRIKDELPDLEDSSRRSPNFVFSVQKESGKQILNIEEISKTYDDNIVLLDVGMKLPRGHKYAIIGPNGVGKSTLLKIIMGEITADEGQYQWGANVSVGYFAQDLDTIKKQNKTVLQWLDEQHPKASEFTLRKTLGKVYLSDNAEKKTLSQLSGGELARLVLANIMLAGHNVLVLDEPTNHLDLEGIEALAKALKKYAGTLIFVSHNRHFIKAIADQIIAINHHHVNHYLGNYDEFIQQYGNYLDE